MAQDIRIRLENGVWVPARDYQKTAYNCFKYSIREYQNLVREEPYEYNDSIQHIKFTVSRELDGGIYMTRENGTKSPLVDWNNVQVFLFDHPEGQPANWYGARNYQIWTYFDFIYSGKQTKNYKSIGTTGYGDYTEIPITDISPNIIFTIYRERHTIFFKRNDVSNTSVRISDYDEQRYGFLGFFHRVTDYDGPILETYTYHMSLTIPPDVILVQAGSDEDMCIVCTEYQQNIKFLPCNHTNTCSECYKKLIQPKCPICRTNIVSIIKK